MAKKSEITEIQVQKRLLVARSEIHRQTLEVEWRQLKSSTQWVGKTFGILKTALPMLAVGAPVAGFMLHKKKKELGTLPQKAALGMQLFRYLRAFWKGFKTGKNRSSLAAEDYKFSEHFRPG